MMLAQMRSTVEQSQRKMRLRRKGKKRRKRIKKRISPSLSFTVNDKDGLILFLILFLLFFPFLLNLIFLWLCSTVDLICASIIVSLLKVKSCLPLPTDQLHPDYDEDN